MQIASYNQESITFLVKCMQYELWYSDANSKLKGRNGLPEKRLANKNRVQSALLLVSYGLRENEVSVLNV
jgi:hypothetical protein